MLEKSYYKDYLNQRLTYLKGWARNADTYRGFMEIGKRVEIEIFREKPIFYTIIFPNTGCLEGVRVLNQSK